jgi:hypothetical protein
LFGYSSCFDDFAILSRFHRSFAFLHHRVKEDDNLSDFSISNVVIVAPLAALPYTKSGDFVHKEELSSIALGEFHFHFLSLGWTISWRCI